MSYRGPDLALLGIVIIVVVAASAAIPFSGADGEPYSPLDHTVSSLGERAVSELHWLFNTGLILGGAFVVLFMVGLVLFTRPWPRRVFGMLGTLTGLAVVAVGVFPVDDLDEHMVAATLTFLGIGSSAAWFAAWELAGSAPFSRRLGWVAAWVVLTSVAFFVLPRVVQPEITFETDFDAGTPRPDIWLAAALEWLVVISALAWISLVAWHERAAAAGSQVAGRW